MYFIYYLKGNRGSGSLVCKHGRIIPLILRKMFMSNRLSDIPLIFSLNRSFISYLHLPVCPDLDTKLRQRWASLL